MVGRERMRVFVGDDVFPATERIQAASFFRAVHCWKESDVVGGKFKDFPPRETLPFNSVVHLLDNFYKLEVGETIQDIPSFDHPFIRNETAKKVIFHQLTPMTDGLIKTPNDYVYRTMQLQKNIQMFRSKSSGKFMFATKLEDMNRKEASLAIVNHNPVFRLFTRGQMAVWRSTEHFLASMINTVQLIPDKTHYFIIPLAPKIFPKSMFNLVTEKISNASIMDKKSYQYSLFAQLYMFIKADAKAKSIFNNIPNDLLSKIVFVFTYSGHYLFWTLSTLKSLNVRNTIYIRLFNHFNGFILRGMNEESSRSNLLERDTQITDDPEQIEEMIARSYSNITHTPLSQIFPKDQDNLSVDTDYISDQDAQDLDKAARKVESLVLEMGKKGTILDLTDINDIVDKNPEDADDEVSVNNEESVGNTADIAPLPSDVTNNRPYYDDSNDLDTPVLPGTNFKLATTKEDVAKLSTAYMEDIDNLARRKVLLDNTLTDAQKKRALEMAKSYKNVKFHGKTIEAIMQAPVDPVLSDIANVDILPESKVPDRSMIGSTVINMDDVYMKRFFDRHLVSCALSMSAQGMYLQDIEESVVNTELTQQTDYIFRYKNVHGKQHSIKFSMPIVRHDGTFLINGVRSSMAKQLTVRPIAKVSPTRVSLASNYNKTIVEKKSTRAHDYLFYITDFLNKIKNQDPNIVTDVKFGIWTVPEKFMCGYEYWKLTQKYNSFKIHHQSNKGQTSFFYFGSVKERRHSSLFGKRGVHLSDNDWARIEKYEAEHQSNFIGIKVGPGAYSPAAYYLDMNSALHMVGSNFSIKASLIDLIAGATRIEPPKILTEWTDIKILDAKFPVGFLLCYRFGLLNVLRRLNVKYKIINTRAKRTEEQALKTSDIVIRFAKGQALVIPRYPLRVSFIMQGLAMFKTNQAEMEDFEHKDIYYQLLLDKKMGSGRTNYLIGIDDTFDMFIDMLTYERLKQMGEPTTFDGLLVRATEMLTYPWHEDSSAMANHYLRGYERFNAVLYNEMCSTMRTYKRQRGSAALFSMNPNTVMQRIIQDPSVGLTEDMNPVHDMQNSTKITFLGMGGRTSESFTELDRRYSKDMLGILSEATPSNSKVGISTQTSMNPTIGSMYGLPMDIDKDKIPPTAMLSSGASLMPGVTQDDGKRASFVGIQLSHWMPTSSGDTLRTRTGFELVAAHRVTDLYAVTAKQDGKVIDVNETLKLAKIQYKDGTTQVLSYATDYGVCSDIMTEQKQVLTVQKGDTFKKHDVLRYNPQFFAPDPDLKRQVTLFHGTTAKVILIENSQTFEDSNVVTEEFSKRLHIRPVEARMITLPRTATIHEYRVLGDQVEISTPLVIFEREDYTDLSGIAMDDKAREYLEKLNRTTPKAKIKGTIVDIKVLYSCDESDMSLKMREMVSTYTKHKLSVSKYVKGSENEYLYSGSSKVPEGSKYKGISIDYDTVVIQYLVREGFDNATGDKIVVDSSLKTVTCMTVKEPPVTERGTKIDVIFSASSVMNRIVNSPMIVGISESVLEQLERNVLDEYFGTPKQATEALLRNIDAVSDEDISWVRASKEIISSDEWKRISEMLNLLWDVSEYDQDTLLESNSYIGYLLDGEVKIPVAVVILKEDEKYKEDICISLYAVHPDSQGKHLGTRFFKLLLSMLKSKGYEWATISVRESNVPAKKIYSQAGFKFSSLVVELDIDGVKRTNKVPEGYHLEYVRDMSEDLKIKLSNFVTRFSSKLTEFDRAHPVSKSNIFVGSRMEQRVCLYKTDPSGRIEAVVTLAMLAQGADGLYTYLYDPLALDVFTFNELIRAAVSYDGVGDSDKFMAWTDDGSKYYQVLLKLGKLWSFRGHLKL